MKIASDYYSIEDVLSPGFFITDGNNISSYNNISNAIFIMLIMLIKFSVLESPGRIRYNEDGLINREKVGISYEKSKQN